MSNQNLKPGWKVWHFEQIAYEVKDRIERPVDSGLERYVGLGHLDTGSLKIWRWGSTSDVEKQKLLFKKGDIIFGRRNAYLRRVAVADFDGVCSAHAMVLRAHEEVVLPEFLPFFMQTDRFWEAALKVSAGSMSPTINWRNIAKEEFALPPLEEQQRIAALLSSLTSTTESLRAAINAEVLLEDAFLKRVFGLYADEESKWPVIELKKLAHIQTGVAKGRKADPELTGDLPYIAVSNVQDGFLDLSEIKSITVEKNKVSQYLLRSGDVLMTEGGDPDKLGRGTVWQEEISGCVHQNHIFAVRPHDDLLDSWFLAALVRSSYGKQYFLSRSKATSNLATINKKQLGNLLVPCPDLGTQKSVVSDWQQIRAGSEAAKERLEAMREIRAKWLSTVFGDTK